MEDTPEDVARKMSNAYCPAKPEEDEEGAKAAGGEGELDAGLESMHLTADALKNPCLDYVQVIALVVCLLGCAGDSAGGLSGREVAHVKVAVVCLLGCRLRVWVVFSNTLAPDP